MTELRKTVLVIGGVILGFMFMMYLIGLAINSGNEIERNWKMKHLENRKQIMNRCVEICTPHGVRSVVLDASDNGKCECK